MERTDTYLLRPAEVVEMLGVSRSWLYEAAKSGRIPCVRLGGRDGPVRFEARELEAWINRSRAIVPSGRDARAGQPSRTVARHEVPPAAHSPVEPRLKQLRLLPPGDA